MDFIVRSAKPDDVGALVCLASGVKLLSLIPDVRTVTQRVARSCDSFAQRIEESLREYIFVAEELSTGRVVGTSALYASYISETHPMHCAHIVHRDGAEFYSRSILCDRYSGIGGFTVDKLYRKHSAKIGTQLGMLRVMLYAMHAEWFTEELFVEIVAPISTDGESKFWNNYGRQFSGLQFAEAYEMARMGQRTFMDCFPLVYPVVKEVECMSPEEVCVPQTALGSQHLARKLGFSFMGSVDPMDGALQYRAQRDSMPLVQNGRWYVATAVPCEHCWIADGTARTLEEPEWGDKKLYLACCYNVDTGFKGGIISACVDGKRIGLDATVLNCFGIAPGESIFAAPYQG